MVLFQHATRWPVIVLALAVVPLQAQEEELRIELGDGVVAIDPRLVEEELSRFDELFAEARLIFTDAIVADKSQDTLEAAFYFDLLFEAMADIEHIPYLNEREQLEFNRFLSAAVDFYETDSQTLEHVETSLTVSALRDELGRYTRSLSFDLGEVSIIDLEGEDRLPITHNAHVERIIQFFNTQGRRNMQAWLNRLPKNAKIIGPILEEEGVPRDFIFLALIESGLNPRALSWAYALGPWQFISSTGKRYGLKRDWWVDERRHVEKSTRAAARYLSDLYEEFGDWYLAMAAYNTGESRVRRAIRVHGTRDYWKLHVLPRQTRNYVPNVMAAFLIAQDPEKYGFTVTPDPEVPWDNVPVDRSLTFDILAQIGGFPADTLRLYNPELRQKATPPVEKGQPYALMIPAGYKQQFLANYDSIASQVGPDLTIVQPLRHRVRRGESLYSISKRYGVPIRRIQQANAIRNRDRLRIGQVLSVPLTASAIKRKQADAPTPPGLRKLYHTVRPNDTLGEIAEAYNVGYSRLRSWNGIRSTSGGNIKVGQRLVVWVPKGWNSGQSLEPPAPLPVPDLSDAQKIYYTVQIGDTLGDIAESHDVGLSKLRLWNGMSSSSNHIRVGQQLVIVQETG
ncbi:MAG: LysM peptidoglycan-binding domain-containing protein [Candidatus Marinimicrobia bacterium]|nr:LysM peptidoglycan-binding domain-containing protein [Candidatus Neomarinimicrobiota bacterium]